MAPFLTERPPQPLPVLGTPSSGGPPFSWGPLPIHPSFSTAHPHGDSSVTRRPALPEGLPPGLRPKVKEGRLPLQGWPAPASGLDLRLPGPEEGTPRGWAARAEIRRLPTALLCGRPRSASCSSASCSLPRD